MKPYFYLTGNCNELYKELESLNIIKNEINTKIIQFGDCFIECDDENCIPVAIFNDSYEFNQEECKNAFKSYVYFVCLICFPEEKVNLIKQVYGGEYIFNFYDIDTCKEFLIGYYYAVETGKFGQHLINDIYVYLGYDVTTNKKNVIKSTESLNANKENSILPKLIFGFSKDDKLKNYIENILETMIKNNYYDFVFYIVHNNLIENEFFKILYMEEK